RARGAWRTVRGAVLRAPVGVREAAVVAAVVVALQVLTFARYYTGATLPPWDFQSHYTTEAFAWWHDGGFFRPVAWLPYLWGGYPGVVNLQNSSFYLPVGAMNLLGLFDQHAAAVLSALHVAFGAVGAYVFARAWRLRPAAALTALVLWHFAAGFYSNASHLDIMRAYAWLPWVLLVTSPRWPWRRPWAPAVAVLLLWQALLGTYPGILIATLYVGLTWVVLHQVTSRPALRDHLLPLAVAGGLAVLMTALRFVPAFLARGAGVPGDGDVSAWSWTMLGTLWFSYADNTIPNDVTMRSLFLPAPALAAAAFVAWRRPLARVAAATGAVAVVLGAPGTPWSGLVAQLPGLDVSRFRFSDFKPFVLFVVVVLAAVGIDEILTRRRAREAGTAGTAVTDAPLGRGRLVALGVLVVTAAVIGAAGPFRLTDWGAQTALLAASAVLLVLACRPLLAGRLRVVVGAVPVVAAVSGLLWAYGTPTPWSVSRADIEQVVFGAPVADVIASRPADLSAEQRPARTHAVPTDIAPTVFDVFSNGSGRVFYSGGLSVDGYANLKGTPTFEQILASLQDDRTRPDAWAFWLAPGLVVATDGDALPDAAVTETCVQEGTCGSLDVRPVSYSPSPELVYDVDAGSATTVAFNEAYYDGWRVEACPADEGACRTLPVRAGDGGQLVTDLPAGRWQLTATYALPGMRAAWLMFAAGLAGVVGWTALTVLAARRRRATAADAPGTDATGTDAPRTDATGTDAPTGDAPGTGRAPDRAGRPA
ncbi:hypothetical protein, partial [Cellulomonas fimi]